MERWRKVLAKIASFGFHWMELNSKDAKELRQSKPVSFLRQTCEAFDKTVIQVRILTSLL